jgi:hypothetical protein
VETVDALKGVVAMLVHLDVELNEGENAYLEDCIAALKKRLPMPHSTTLSWDTETFIRVAAEWMMETPSDEGAPHEEPRWAGRSDSHEEVYAPNLD